MTEPPRSVSAPRRRRRLRMCFAGVALCLLGVNLVAFLHAGAMLNYTAAGERTPSPEELSWPARAVVLFSGVRVPRPRNSRSPADAGLESEVLRFESERGETLEAWYLPAPREVLFLLFHGYASSKSSLLPLARVLNEGGYPSVLVDFHGSGGSGGGSTSIGYFESGDVEAACAYARRTWPRKKLILYGHSMGGAAVLRAVAKGAQPDAIVVEATFDSLEHAVENRFRSMGLPPKPLAQLLVFWGGVRAGFNGFKHRPLDYARSVDCPSLVLHGADDVRVTEQEARDLFDALAGWKRFSSYPGVGHRPVFIGQRERWLADLGGLLEQL